MNYARKNIDAPWVHSKVSLHYMIKYVCILFLHLYHMNFHDVWYIIMFWHWFWLSSNIVTALNAFFKDYHKVSIRLKRPILFSGVYLNQKSTVAQAQPSYKTTLAQPNWHSRAILNLKKIICKMRAPKARAQIVWIFSNKWFLYNVQFHQICIRTSASVI